jgi:glycosyltransferase involved in cell wall biosynthesis
VPRDLPDQVKLINLDKNSGEAHAVNVAWSLCKSDYFAVISDDDPQPDNWLSVLTKAAKLQPNFVAYFPSTYVVKENEVKLGQFAHQYDKETFHKLLRSPCLSGVLINAKLLRSLYVKKLRID